MTFSTRQTRSQARLNRLGSSSSPVALRSCSLLVDDAALGTAGCPKGEADFGDGCVAVCPNGEADFGDGCVPATCFVDCTYADTACAAGSICPGGTPVSAECADRSAFRESPCACTALQELAALSPSLQAAAPWVYLESTAYCQTGELLVDCTAVGEVQLPAGVLGDNVGLAGALPPSLGDLGSSLTELRLYDNDITSLPTELGALTGLGFLGLGRNAIYVSVPTELGALTDLAVLDLSFNQLTGVPTEFRTVNPSGDCFLSDNPGFSCANVGAGTSCCTGDEGYGNCPGGTSTCYSG